MYNIWFGTFSLSKRAETKFTLVCRCEKQRSLLAAIDNQGAEATQNP